jgi:hypothetical protein
MERLIVNKVKCVNKQLVSGVLCHIACFLTSFFVTGNHVKMM